MKSNSNFKNTLLIFFLFLTSVVVYQFPLSLDLTANKINSLSEANRTLLSTLDKPLTVELYSTQQNIIEHVQTILSLFQKESAHIVLNLHHEPMNTRDKSRLRLETNNNLLLTYDDRKKAIDINPSKWNEQAFSNLVQHMIRTKEDWVVFLSGHGECDPLSNANQDLSQLTNKLKTTGINIASLNLGEIGNIPGNTKMLVIADPKIAFLPQETNQILNYVNQGGNLLWLVNPNAVPHLDKLAKHLGITWQPGTIIDQKSHAMGTPHPAISIMTQYPVHTVTEQLNILTVFPRARPLQYEAASKLGWQASPLLVTNASTTLEVYPTKKAQQTPRGPFTIGIALEKNNQRIVVIGNTHFLSNASLHNYGNLQLANNLFTWLMGSDVLVSNGTKPVVDLSFAQSAFTATTTQFIFPFCLPLIYLFIGWQIKRARRQRSAINIV
ncbi:MAG TPA: GldG family protein [Gammaproteobacteria bacterium]|nr:GldG family protein [Gammaproteobacteria bacterium]